MDYLKWAAEDLGLAPMNSESYANSRAKESNSGQSCSNSTASESSNEAPMLADEQHTI
jgi:hypothetical protein